ncbi:MAG: hypothetical protein IMZ62_10195, partial [Chloroflexi bacterium]|nr:hypothetical protein [Chloroflexota bacterium]
MFSQTSWDGDQLDQDWTNSANWSTGVVPGAGTNVIIPVVATGYPDLGVLAPDQAVNNLTISAGATIAVAARTLTVNGTSSLAGNITASGAGTIRLIGAVTVNVGAATLTLSTAGGSIILGSTVTGFAGTESLILNAGAGTITLGGMIGGAPGLVGFQATCGSGLTLPQISASGNIAITAGGTITVNAAVSSTTGALS